MPYLSCRDAGILRPNLGISVPQAVVVPAGGPSHLASPPVRMQGTAGLCREDPALEIVVLRWQLQAAL